MIVATLASLATREHLLSRVIKYLTPQVDAICVYLNGYNGVPEFLKQPKVVHAVLSNDAGWRGAEAKLWFWDRDQFKAAPYWEDDDIAIICDDDLGYPPNYVAKHVEFLAANPGTISCVHGSIITEPFVRYCDDRLVTRVGDELTRHAQCHIPGTGTMAFRRGDFNFSMKNDVKWSHCVDVMAAIAAKNQGIKCYSLARPKGWLSAFQLPRGGNGVFKSRTGARNDAYESNTLRRAIPWDTLPTEGFTPRNR